MSISSEITRITGNIASAYTAVSGKGGTLPSSRNSANLPAAIDSIPSGSTLPDAETNLFGSAVVAHIYGAEWAGTASTAWTRTDEAASFGACNPYYSGMSGVPSSPFDNLMPWSGMVKEERTGGTMVKIPKFWFKWSGGGGQPLKLQIADAPVDGFYVSPAHQDRSDGKGERDYVYVGRYHCSATNYKSIAGDPKNRVTRSNARTAIHNLGGNIWQYDFMMRATIQMLYLVEFADWDSQRKIGYGAGNGTSPEQTGKTNQLTYHTGTCNATRETYGTGVQYRWIEDLWGNVLDWLDGCYNNDNGLNVIKKPSDFSDSENGIAVGMPVTGYPKVMTVSTVQGYEFAIFQTTVGGSYGTYVPDYMYYLATSPCLRVGGDYAQNLAYGLFFTYYHTATSSGQNVGCRLMELP